MSEIVVTREHTLGAKKARTAAQKVADHLGAEFDLRHEWDGDVMRFQRTGVSGELTVSRNEVEIRVRLGFMLSMLKPKIESEIRRFLDEDFG